MDLLPGIPDLTFQIICPINGDAGSAQDFGRGVWRIRSSPVDVRVKQLYKSNSHCLNTLDNTDVAHELLQWHKVRHSNVISVFGIFHHDLTPFLVTPWITGGNLNVFLMQHHQFLSHVDLMSLIRDVAAGLHHLHSFSIVHGSLIGANILIDNGQRACLTDFGLASIRGPIRGSAFLRTSSDAPGAIRWTATELVAKDVERPTIHSDVYSFGSIALQIITGKVPWSEFEDEFDVVVKIGRGLVPLKPEGCHMTESLWAFIQRCWEFVPEDRPTSFNALDFAEIEFRATLSCDPAVQPSQGVLSQTPGSSRLENHLISIPSSPALSRVASPVATLDSRHIKSPRVVFNVNTINDRLRYIAPLETSANHWIPKSAIEAQLDVDSPAMIDRKVKALLSRLTMETFDSVSDQIIQWANKSVNENDGHTLVQVIQLVFEKATETAGSEIYALLCRKMMERISPEVQDHRIKNAEGKSIVGGLFFMKHLLNRCQVVFERGWSTEVTTDEKGPEEAELYSDEYYPKKAKRQGLGLIKFMGELFKLQMLTERVMHECVKKLLGNLDEEEIETLCQLLKTVGQLLDTPEAREHMDVYFTCMKELGESPDVSIHMQFMLQDVVALRERKWVGRNVVASPTTIATIHKGVRWIDTAKNRATAENESYNPQPMSPGGSRRGGERNQAHGPNGRAVAEGSISRPPPDPKSDDLSQFGKISKGAPKVIMFAGGTNDSESLSTSLNSNIFRMFSQSPELTPEHSTQHSHSTSRKTSIDLGQAGVPEPPLQHKKLQLFPQPKTIVEENMLASSDDALERAPTSMSEADAKKKIDEDVNEFFTVRNLEEADVYFINLPREHRFRLVDKLVEFALESKEEEDARLVGELFARVTSNGQCTPEVFEDGFIPMAEFLDDIAIVAPKTFEYMAIMLRGAGLEKEPERLQRLASKLEDSNKLISLVA